MVTLVFLGKFSDIAPQDLSRVALPAEIGTLSDLLGWIARRAPILGQALDGVPMRLVVNRHIVSDMTMRVSDGDEIAFLPPMSGG